MDMSTSAEAAVAANGGEVRDVDHDRKVDNRDESFHSTILHDLGEVNRLIQNIIANAHTEAQKAENSGRGAKRSGQGRGGAPPAQRRAVAHDLKGEARAPPPTKKRQTGEEGKVDMMRQRWVEETHKTKATPPQTKRQRGEEGKVGFPNRT